MRNWGAIADRGAHRAAMGGASAAFAVGVGLAVCVALLLASSPAEAHQDCPPAALSDIKNKQSHCAELCKHVVRPARPLITRAGETDQPSVPPAPHCAALSLPAVVALTAVTPAQSYVRATGVMRIGNIVLLN